MASFSLQKTSLSESMMERTNSALREDTIYAAVDTGLEQASPRYSIQEQQFHNELETAVDMYYSTGLCCCDPTCGASNTAVFVATGSVCERVSLKCTHACACLCRRARAGGAKSKFTSSNEPMAKLWLTGPSPPRNMSCWHSFWYLLNWNQVTRVRLLAGVASLPGY